jgi:hypothetical protein
MRQQQRIAFSVILFAVLVVGALLGHGLSADYPAVHQEGRMKHHGIGCYSRDDLDRYFKILLSNDEAAGASFYVATLASGACITLKEGTTVIVDEHPVGDNFCVRPLGETRCVWTHSGWVAR